MALSVLLPAFLTEQRSLPLWTAGTVNAVVSLVSVPGSLLAGLLLRRGVGYAGLTYVAIAVPVAAVPAFAAIAWPASAVAAGVLSLANGVLIAGVFAAVPALAGPGPRLDLVNGLIAQLGGIGALLGPPLLTQATSLGWGRLALPVAAIALPGSALVWVAVRRLPAPVRADADVLAPG